MSEGTPRTVRVEANHLQAPQRRRSARFGSPGAPRERETKMAPGEKRSITVRKIVPRKTAAVTGSNKENSPRRDPNRRTPTSAGRRRPRAPGAPPGGPQPQPADPPDPPDPVWTQKVRRSYSKLGDKLGDSSLLSPGPRETLFGFDKLSSPAGLTRFSLEADGCGPEPDPNIPGVAVVKEKRKKRKVKQINTEELEVLAARMNQEFREAEQFELVVE